MKDHIVYTVHSASPGAHIQQKGVILGYFCTFAIFCPFWLARASPKRVCVGFLMTCLIQLMHWYQGRGVGEENLFIRHRAKLFGHCRTMWAT
ncbi:hypothetical protein BGW80DRAFT_1306004 [Lactifluus volemus]|nr:hypothetical protein BGW80DRAFT_1306004 [Lactifluus volemus]